MAADNLDNCVRYCTGRVFGQSEDEIRAKAIVGECPGPRIVEYISKLTGEFEGLMGVDGSITCGLARGSHLDYIDSNLMSPVDGATLHVPHEVSQQELRER